MIRQYLKHWSSIFLLGLSIISAATFLYRIQADFYQMPIDFLIFLKAAKNYQVEGQLYERSNNYPETYHPSAAIFKFPPPFQLALLPLTKISNHVNLLLILKNLLTGMYLLSTWLIFLYLKEEFALNREQKIRLGSLMAITTFWFMPFFESIRWLLTEIPLLLIFTGSFLLLKKSRIFSFLSGTMIAYAACIKIYPAFMAGQFLANKNIYALAGLAAGSTIVLILSIWFFGIEEHLFYISTLLPVLLNEEVTSKWVNLNLEKFLFSTGVISETSGHLFQLIRLVFLAWFVRILIKYHKALMRDSFLCFSLFTTIIFFCFPNYWPQYQLYLTIPIAYLYATYLQQTNTICLILLLSITATLFIPDSLWEQISLIEIRVYQLDPVMLQNEASAHGTGKTLFRHLPLSWAAYYFYESRALAPVMLWLLQIRKLYLLKQP